MGVSLSCGCFTELWVLDQCKTAFQVAWYKIFGRSAAGPNVKVRLNDYYLPGEHLYWCLMFVCKVVSVTGRKV